MGGQDGCDRRIEVFVKIQKKWVGGRGWVGGQGGCKRNIKVFVKIQKKIGEGVGGRVLGGGGQGSGWM